MPISEKLNKTKKKNTKLINIVDWGEKERNRKIDDFSEYAIIILVILLFVLLLYKKISLSFPFIVIHKPLE